jgi:hypothetical protein
MEEGFTLFKIGEDIQAKIAGFIKLKKMRQSVFGPKGVISTLKDKFPQVIF